jgi:NAD(P)-dependent dehydrogenase (short-subunit alcohol dehydrogenase family)
MAARLLAAGMKVVHHLASRGASRRSAQDPRQGQRRIHALKLDVTDRDGFARAADEAEKVFGKVHLLANNAGVGIRAGVAEATFKDLGLGPGRESRRRINGITTLLPRMRTHGEGATC